MARWVWRGLVGTAVGGALGWAYASLKGGCPGGVCLTQQHPAATIGVFALIGLAVVLGSRD